MSTSTPAQEVEELLRAAGVADGISERLSTYAALLLEANRNVNLTGATTPVALVPHLLDALTLGPFVSSEVRLVDVGSGGGLPGIPLALAFGVTPTLLEPIAKKTAFLRDALQRLDLPGQALALRAEVAGRDAAFRETFDVATARAVSSAPTVAELCLPLLRIGGRLLMQRGALSERERQALDDAVAMLGGRVAGEQIVEGERRIVAIDKVAATQQRFPRRNGIPEKRPLCF